MKILIIDNYDSFTYNLVHLVKEISGDRPDVLRNDVLALQDLEVYDKLLLSPGPGIPAEAGLLNKVIRKYAASKSILGVCLGHQAIGEVFGAQLENLATVFHGVATTIKQLQPDSLFAGIPPEFEAGRYHSWAISREAFPESLEITAEDGLGHIMAMRHSSFDVRGIQFHPESMLTPQGKRILSNWLAE